MLLESFIDDTDKAGDGDTGDEDLDKAKRGRRGCKQSSGAREVRGSSRTPSMWVRVAHFCFRWPKCVIFAVLVVASPFFVRAAGLKYTLDQLQLIPRDSVARKTFEAMAERNGGKPGWNYPLGMFNDMKLIVCTKRNVSGSASGGSASGGSLAAGKGWRADGSSVSATQGFGLSQSIAHSARNASTANDLGPLRRHPLRWPPLPPPSSPAMSQAAWDALQAAVEAVETEVPSFTREGGVVYAPYLFRGQSITAEEAHLLLMDDSRQGMGEGSMGKGEGSMGKGEGSIGVSADESGDARTFPACCAPGGGAGLEYRLMLTLHSLTNGAQFAANSTNSTHNSTAAWPGPGAGEIGVGGGGCVVARMMSGWNPVGGDGGAMVRAAKKVVAQSKQNADKKSKTVMPFEPDFELLAYSAEMDSYGATEAVYEWFPTLIAATAALLFIAALVAFRSIIVAIRLLLTIAITISWIYGVGVVVFQDQLFYMGNNPDTGVNSHHTPGGEGAGFYWLIPILLFAVCVGLTLDYDMFLLCRVYEYRRQGYSTTDATLLGVEATGPIVTAAGLIMAAAFSAMMATQETVLNQFGFVLVFTALVDTFVVRMLLVPCLMALGVEYTWWPGKVPPVTKHI
jgi:hypothetical protein